MPGWFHSSGGQDHGPFSGEEIKARAARGLLKEDDWVWPEGTDRSQGTPANAVLDFRTLRAPTVNVPDWLSDIAQLENRKPAPARANLDPPGWVDDLRVWYGWELALEPAPLSKPAGPSKTGVPAPRRSRTAAARPVTRWHAPSPDPAIKDSAESVADRAIAETGFDPRTGQVVDAERFAKWKQQAGQACHSSLAPTNASIMEVFRNARLAIEQWVDDERQRTLIMEKESRELITNPELAAILKTYAGYGPMLQEKLLAHVDFLVANRRKYYAACIK